MSLPADTVLGFFVLRVVQGLLGGSFHSYFPCLWYPKHKGWNPWSPAFGVSLWSVVHIIMGCRNKLMMSLIVLLMGCVFALPVNRTNYVDSHLKRWGNLEENGNSHCVGDLFWHTFSCEACCL